MQEIAEKKHIKDEIWIALEEDTIIQEDFQKILEHTNNCTWCADKLAGSLEQQDTMMQPPAFLRDEILKRTRQLDVQAATKLRNSSRQMQLMLYSLKVGAAVVFSVFILSLTSNFQDINFTQVDIPKDMVRQESVIDKMSNTANFITNKLNDVSNYFFNGGK